MHPMAEQILADELAKHPSRLAQRGGFLRRQIRLKIAIENQGKTTCDTASPAVAVMLHLRSRYVSKAAILTLPIQLVPVENRSPA